MLCSRILWTSSTVALAMLLTACGGTTSAPASSIAAPSAPGPSSAAASTVAKPASSASVVSVGSAATGTIKVALLEPATGPFAELAKDNVDGFNLYLASINNTVAGRKIEAVVADTQGQTDVALTKAKQLVENDKVSVLMGITLSAECYAVASYARDVQVPFIASGNCAAQNMMVDPKFKSPYTVRITQNVTVEADPPAEWATKQGYKNAILVATNSGGTLENADGFASAFVKRGGSIIQEQYPEITVTDYGPFLAQLNKNADLLMTFLPGTNGLHYFDQYGNYAGQSKLQIIDGFGTNTAGPTLGQLKDKLVGVVGENYYSDAIDTPENKSFLQAFQAKYPGRIVSGDVVQGYTGAQVLAAALGKVGGRIEDKQGFLQALYATDIATPKGQVKLDQDHDIVENAYVWRVTREGDKIGTKLLETYTGVSRAWNRTPEELAKLPYGQMKGKWVGMTKDKLDQLIKG